MRPEEIIHNFENVEEAGKGTWTARCPNHEDRKNSLSISIGDDGRTLLYCHASCATADVLRAVGLKARDLFTDSGGKVNATAPKRKIVATYDYHDADGNLVYQAVRLKPKGFRQRRPDGNGGWRWNMNSVDRVPYRLPELIKSDADAIIFVPEGEKDVDRLRDLGSVATCNVGGAGKWRDEFGDHLRDRHVVVLPDNDGAGHKHAEHIANSLSGVATSIKVIELPNLPAKCDVSDWLDAGGTMAQLMEIVDSAVEWTPQTTETKSRDEKPSQATRLVELVTDIEFFHTPASESYATLRVDDHLETWRVRSAQFKRYLARLFYRDNGSAIGSQALQDATNVLESKAQFDGDQHDVHVRVAGHGDKIYLDLCNTAWQVVEIDADGWCVIDESPVKFRRARAMLPLPTPEAGGDIAELRSFLNVTDDGMPLVLGFLVAALRPQGPYPILNLHGEQGSAKTTAARVIRRLTDPNSALVRAEPRDARDLMIAANNGWVIALDNLSFIRSWLSDALCRLSTGGGFSTRALYENDEEVIFDAMRPVILTGIEELAARGDLIDRSLIISLPTISEQDRRTESVFWEEFDAVHPKLLGAILTATSTAIMNHPYVSHDNLPRMADFATWVIAAEPGLGLSSGEFMSRYTQNRDEANAAVLESSQVAKFIIELADDDWEGSASELLEELDERAGFNDSNSKKRPKGWPGTPRAMTGAVKRLAPNLRKAGIDVTFGRRRRRYISIRRNTETTGATGATGADQNSPADSCAGTELPTGATGAPTGAPGAEVGSDRACSSEPAATGAPTGAPKQAENTEKTTSCAGAPVAPQENSSVLTGRERLTL